MRYFEKISYKQFQKDISNDFDLYNKYDLPKRSTTDSAGYDLKSVENIVIKPNEAKVVRTGLKVCMNKGEVFLIYVRSSLGYKYDISLSNGVGVIDRDYYNNDDNEGHFSIKLRNDGDKDFTVNIGDRVAQGIFTKYEVVDNEDNIEVKRIGGIGSTGKGEKL
ncbi:MAG TPA: dUTP diphosphatase [Bacilli bacterium]|nr:dUTP diphosphatase [Bacilli bacterium]